MKIAAALLAAVLLVVVLMLYSGPVTPVFTISRSLRTIASAQGDFRNQDRDGDGKREYWRQDIAGLYTLKNGGTPIKLIELSLAAADGNPVEDITPYAVRNPKGGYWVRAIRFVGEETPDPQRFSACAYPHLPSRNDPFMYVVCQDGQVFRKAAVRGGVDRYPADPTCEGWERVE